MKLCYQRGIVWGASLTLLLVVGAGCSKAPEPALPTSVSDPQLTNSRVAAIQNDPHMSPADKERAIATLKSRQSGAGAPTAR
ncbi:hypothetical protein IAD21_06305 [Abditibacteriota bacterium]|nr:hypothetical protein IAD21_06305 [Abditibacteriota bacterium]